MTSNVHYMSERHDWETPQFLFDGLNAEFGFEVDVCATAENAKCRKFFTSQDNGLVQHWEGVCWMNPPMAEKASGGCERRLSRLSRAPRWYAWYRPERIPNGGIATRCEGRSATCEADSSSAIPKTQRPFPAQLSFSGRRSWDGVRWFPESTGLEG